MQMKCPNYKLIAHIIVISLVAICYLTGYYSWYSLHTATGVLVVVLLFCYLARWFLTSKLRGLFRAIAHPLSRMRKISMVVRYILQLLVLMVLVLYGVIGLFSYNDFSYSGPLAIFINLDGAISLGRIHVLIDQAIIFIITSHIFKEISLRLVQSKKINYA